MVAQDKANITPICSATDSKDMVPSEYKTDPMLDHRCRRRPTIEFPLDRHVLILRISCRVTSIRPKSYVGLMLGHHGRRCPNIKSTLSQHVRLLI